MRSHSQGRKQETKTLQRLLAVCEDHQIPFTFDIVGHLFASECTGTHPDPYPDGWFDRDPESDAASDPHFYAPDLVEMIQQTSVNHEICTHTFSHIPCKEVPNELVDWELKRVADIHQAELGVDITSFVPPRHSPPSKDVLKENEIQIIREPADRTPPKNRIHAVWNDLFRDHPVRDPKIIDDVVEIYSTAWGSLNANILSDGQQSPHPIYHLLPTPIRKYLHKRYLLTGIEKAIENDSYAHYWTHLYDISNRPQLETVTWFIKQVAECRRREDVYFLPMRDLNLYIRNHAQ